MPNRVIRSEILTSDPVNRLSWAAEVFYRRLMSVADDYGRYDGRPAIIRSNVFPLKLDKVSEADVVKWMGECSEAELISFYQIDNKPYLEILKFGQTLRIKKSKYPANNMQADASRCLHDENMCMSETNPNPNQEFEIEIEKKEITFKKIYDELTDSQRWIDETALIHKKDPMFVREKLIEFLNDLKLKDDYYKGLRDIKNHFINWFKKEKEKISAKKEKPKSEIKDLTWEQ